MSELRVDSVGDQSDDPALARAEPVSERRRDSLSSAIVRDLSSRIDGGELRPGDRLPTERELMEQHGVSRTVVREALSSLRSSGRVDTQQGRGAFVLGTPIATGAMGSNLNVVPLHTVQDVLNVMDVRIGLESEGASLAAQHRQEGHLRRLREALAALELRGSSYQEDDLAFHMAVAQATGNPYFVEVLTSLSGSLIAPRGRIDTFGSDDQARDLHRQRVNLEHSQILQAIERGDGEAARAAMRLHLANSRERLRHMLEYAERMQSSPSA